MTNNKKQKNDTIVRLHNILDSDSKKNLSDEDTQYIKSLIVRLEETPNRKMISKQTVVKDYKIDETDLLKPKVTIHIREVKRKIEVVKYKDEKKEIAYEKEIFEVEKVEVIGTKFIQVKPKEIAKPKIEVIGKGLKPEEELTEWEEIDIKPNGTKKIIEQKKESEKKIPFEWESDKIEKRKEKIVEFKEIPVSDEAIFEEKEFPEEKGLDIASKIEAFKDMRSINSKTAVLLYDNGYISTEHLKDASYEDLIKIKGIKRRTANKIFKELTKKIDEAIRVKPISIGETAEGEVKQDEIKEEVIVKIKETPAPVELRRKTFEWEPTKKEKDLSVIIKEPVVDESKKIEAFKDIKNINESVAVLLYDNGYTSVDSLKNISVKDLAKLTGINKRIAKKIKKELNLKFVASIEEKEPAKDLVEDEDEWATEYFVEDEETPSKQIIAEVEEKKTIFEPKKSKIKEFVEVKPSKKEIQPKKEENVFKEIKSIDEKIAILLRDNNINSIEDLNRITLKQLTKIRGIKRKTAKQIKKELAEFLEKVKDIDEDSKAEAKLRKIAEEEDEWETFDEDKISPSHIDEIKGYMYKDYTLYEKEIPVKYGKNRIIRLFSKAEPAGAKPIELPKGYYVVINQKTGIPYLKKKK